MLMLDRFGFRTWQEQYRTHHFNPADHAEHVETCDFCNDGKAALKAPERIKSVWCRKCDVEVREQFKLSDDDIIYT